MPYLWQGSERIELCRKYRPARQPVPIIVEVSLVLGADVHGEDVVGALLVHDVRRQVVDVPAIKQVMSVHRVAHGRHVASYKKNLSTAWKLDQNITTFHEPRYYTNIVIVKTMLIVAIQTIY